MINPIKVIHLYTVGTEQIVDNYFLCTSYTKLWAHIHTRLTEAVVKKYNCVDKWLDPLRYIAFFIEIM